MRRTALSLIGFLALAGLTGYVATSGLLDSSDELPASARPDVYAHPDVQKISYSKASMDTNEVAIPKPTIPESPEITDILVRELSEYLSGSKSAKAALDAAAVDMNKLLGDCAPLKYPVQ